MHDSDTLMELSIEQFDAWFSGGPRIRSRGPALDFRGA